MILKNQCFCKIITTTTTTIAMVNFITQVTSALLTLVDLNMKIIISITYTSTNFFRHIVHMTWDTMAYNSLSPKHFFSR